MDFGLWTLDLTLDASAAARTTEKQLFQRDYRDFRTDPKEISEHRTQNTDLRTLKYTLKNEDYMLFRVVEVIA